MGNALIVANGTKFGNLTIINETDIHICPCGLRRRMFLCRCKCGKEVKVQLGNLRSGNTTRCNTCRSRSSITGHGYRWKHGMEGSPEYNIWKSMIQRCRDKKHHSYLRYGGRGIHVSPEWMEFVAFYRDMGRQKHGMTIERIDNNKGYSKENCRWATRKEQANNTKRNHFLVFRNKRKTIAQWSDETGISGATIWARIRLGWSIERSLTQRVQ